MILRRARIRLEKALARQAAVALIGPRQVGKTTLAQEIGESRPSIYLDLESPSDRAKLSEPELFLREQGDRLVILDEIHRAPELFQVLRGVIDAKRRQGHRHGQFLVLGSAAIDLLKQSGESLAGRIEYVQLNSLDVLEVPPVEETRLWIRGGFPDSFLAPVDDDSFAFRRNFIQTYLERDVPQFGPRIPSETLERLWTMLAHNQASLLNASKLAASLALSAPTVTSYIDLLADLLLVRRLRPFHANTGKRLTKSPKVYVRDSGLLHALLGLKDFNELAGHPVAGASWEGFVIENLLSASPDRSIASFYRTAAGAEIDLLLEIPGKHGAWAIEIKRSSAPRPERGFYNAIADVQPKASFVVYPGSASYPLSEGVQAIGLRELTTRLAAI
jgi:uncharacterized protein